MSFLHFLLGYDKPLSFCDWKIPIGLRSQLFSCNDVDNAHGISDVNIPILVHIGSNLNEGGVWLPDKVIENADNIIDLHISVIVHISIQYVKRELLKGTDGAELNVIGKSDGRFGSVDELTMLSKITFPIPGSLMIVLI